MVVLLDSGKHIKLRPREAMLFTHLIESYPNSFSRIEMAEKIWRDTYVTPTTINQTIKSLRDHINDKSKSIIVTIPQEGYRLGYQPKYVPFNEVVHEDVQLAEKQPKIADKSFKVSKTQFAMLALLQAIVFVVAFISFAQFPVNDHIKVDNVNFLFTPTKQEQARFIDQSKDKVFIAHYQDYYSVCSVKGKGRMECKKVAQ